MASLTISVADLQETTSPEKPTVCSPGTKATFTPSTDAGSPDSVAAPEVGEGQSWMAAALPQIGEATEGADDAGSPDAVAAPEVEEGSPDSIAAPEVEEGQTWTAAALPKSPDSIVTPEDEEAWMAAVLPQIGAATEEAETASWMAEALRAETSTNEDLASMRYLPKLGSEVKSESGSGKLLLSFGASGKLSLAYEGAAASVNEYLAYEETISVSEETPVKLTSSYGEKAFHPASPMVPRSPFLQRSPSYDPETKAAAFSKVAQEDEDSEDGEEDEPSFCNERRAALSKIQLQCATAATYVVAEEGWRGVLSDTRAMFAAALAHMAPQGPRGY